jgi:triosephosphate isomerase
MASRLVAGNWKMNADAGSLAEVQALRTALEDRPAKCGVGVCPPATVLAAVAAALADSGIRAGGQDCHSEPSGAFTGDISAEMLRDAGAELVIVGHSERRHGHGESDAVVAAKAKAAARAGLTAIVCVGETEAERDGGKTLDVVGRQVRNSIPQGLKASGLVIAYEPVWAIGTGRVPGNGDIETVHAFIRDRLADRFGSEAAAVPILYGGSVKPGNAAEILALANVDGALVGGASLKAEDFLKIIYAA